jgi:hypothetical protein
MALYCIKSFHSRADAPATGKFKTKAWYANFILPNTPSTLLPYSFSISRGKITTSAYHVMRALYHLGKAHPQVADGG